MSAIPPHSMETEQAVLGAMLMSKKAIGDCRERLIEEDFFDDRHQALFRAISELDDKNLPADLVTLTEKLTAAGQIQMVGGSAYLSRLVEMVPAASRSGVYADKVKDIAIRRNVRTAGMEIVQQAADAKNADDAVDFAEKALLEAAQRKNIAEVLTLKKSSMDVLSTVAKAYENKTGIIGIPTGYKALDKILHGLQKGNMYVVAARPSMGKTALCMSIAKNVSKKHHVLVFSLEMDSHDLTLRMMSDMSNIEIYRMQSGFLKEGEAEELVKCSEQMGRMKLNIVDKPLMTIQEIRSVARRQAMSKELDLIIIDHMQLISAGTTEFKGDTVREMTFISKTIKGIAKELQVPIIALSQLSRQVENRTEPIPRLSDLRESGAIEQDADVVAFIYRDEYYKKDQSDRKGTADLIVEKNRNGATGVVNFLFDGRFTRFSGMESYEEMQKPREPDPFLTGIDN